MALIIGGPGYLQAAVHHSSDFGWRAGQDVTDAFAELFETDRLTTGDELVLDDTYRIRGTHDLPDRFILSARQGAGFEVIAPKEASGPFLSLGHGNTLRNLTIRYVNTPAPGPHSVSPKRMEHFTWMTGIRASGKRDLLIENCRFIGSVSHHIKLTDCPRPRIVGCHIVGGFWTVNLAGSVTDAVFLRCVFEKCQGDGIKTSGRGPRGVQRVLVDTCVFQDCGRDGIDTTGGFKNSVVRRTIFRRLFSGLDLKSGYDTDEDLSPDIQNTGIRIEHCHFVDIPSAIAFSTIDRGLVERGKHFLTLDNAERYAPHDVDIVDCVFGQTTKPAERQGSGGKMLMVKGAHSIRYRNARFFSPNMKIAVYTNVFETFGPKTLSKEASAVLNHNVSGTIAGPVEEPAFGQTRAPFSFGPQPMD